MEEALEHKDIFKSYVIQDGDPADKWAEVDVIVEETYRTGAQEHLYIEPQAMVADGCCG